jgi:hypothetical protein
MSSISIANSRFPENQYTKIKCCDGLRELISRNWSEADLVKFDDITYNHGFNVLNELMIDSIFNNIETERKFQDRLYKRKIFMEIDADYQLMKKYYKNLETNETFHRLRKMRRQLYDELTAG